jgi:hypothetical protein
MEWQDCLKDRFCITVLTEKPIRPFKDRQAVSQEVPLPFYASSMLE